MSNMYGNGNPSKAWYRFWNSFLKTQNLYSYQFANNPVALTAETSQTDAMASRARRVPVGHGVWMSYGMSDGEERVIVVTTAGGRQLMAVRPNGDFLVTVHTAYDRWKLASLTFLRSVWYSRRYAFIVATEPNYYQDLYMADPDKPVAYFDEYMFGGGWGNKGASWFRLRKNTDPKVKQEWEIVPVRRKGYGHIHLDKSFVTYVGNRHRGVMNGWAAFLARREERYKRLRRKKDREDGAPPLPKKPRFFSDENVETLAAALNVRAPAGKIRRLDIHQFRKNTEGVKT